MLAFKLETYYSLRFPFPAFDIFHIDWFISPGSGLEGSLKITGQNRNELWRANQQDAAEFVRSFIEEYHCYGYLTYPDGDSYTIEYYQSGNLINKHTSMSEQDVNHIMHAYHEVRIDYFEIRKD